jgi:hypothetical protein
MKKIVLNIIVILSYFLYVGKTFAQENLPDGYPPSPYGGTDDEPPASIDNIIVGAMLLAIVLAYYFIQKQKSSVKI